MAVLIGSVILAVYVGILCFVAWGVYRPGKPYLSIIAVIIGLIAPVYDGIFGALEFNRFASNHPGTMPPPQPIPVEGLLIEGRTVQTPLDAIRFNPTHFGRFSYVEYPRESAAQLKPAPDEPLQAYIQFFQTTPDNPDCVEVLETGANEPICIGVTSSLEPKSEYAYLQFPTTNNWVQLNDSKLFPILGSHTRVRKVRTNEIIAEVWRFKQPVKLLPIFSWRVGYNPELKNRESARMVLKPTELRPQ